MRAVPLLLAVAVGYARPASAQVPAPPPVNLAAALPRDWSPQYFADRMILTPPGWHLFHTCALIVMAGEELGGDFRQWFDRKFEQGREGRAVTQQGEVVSGRSGEGYDFLHSTAQLSDNLGRRAHLFLYAAHAGTRGEPVAFFSENDEHFAKFLPTVQEFVAKLRYAAPPAAPAPAVAVTRADSAPTGRPAPQADPVPPRAVEPRRGDLQVESMYWKLISPIRGTVDHLTFYSNGRVSRGTSSEGPLAVDLSDAATYTVVGDQVRITWAGGETSTYRRDAEGLVTAGDYREWKRLPNVDGLRLQGTYTYGGDDGPWISFGADGTFRESGVLGLVTFYQLTNAPAPPPAGSGRYDIRDYTLTLRYAGGGTWRMMFYLMPNANLSRPESFVINAYVFAAQQP